MFVFILGLVLPFVYGGCNGGGGGGNDNSTPAPEITSVALLKNGQQTLTFEIGDMYNLAVHAFDTDLDMEKIFIDQFLLPNLDAPYYPTTEFILPSQSEVNMVYFLLEDGQVTGPAGNWRICFLIVDAVGNESNEFCVNIVTGGVQTNKAQSLYNGMRMD